MPDPTVYSVEPKLVKVRLLGSDAVPSTFVTNAAITTSQHETTVAFFEALMPMGPEAARGDSQEVPARCVSRIVMPTSRFLEISQLFVRVAEQVQAAQAAAAHASEAKK